jgi:hypothetical protein
VASEGIGSGYKALAKRLTMEQLLQAEMMASEYLNATDTLSGRTRAKPAPRLLNREKFRAASGG